MKKIILTISSVILFIACSKPGLAPIPKDAIQPTIVTQQTPNDTDDPAVWVNKNNPDESIIVGTDKFKENGGLYAYNLKGEIINKIVPLNRPNNVDVAYGFNYQGKQIDIAITTERGNNKIRIVSLPDFKLIDNGGVEVFANEEFRDPMGIATYKLGDKIYAIVGRKSGPSENYLFQYLLEDNNGKIEAKLVRKFGKYSGKKEIEAIAVDQELGFIYYCDETAGVRKYYADPSKGNEELSFFGQKDFKRDHEGIAIYKTSSTDGYILISDQQANYFNVYKREGDTNNPNKHEIIAKIPVSTIECDGADAINFNFNSTFPKGFFIAMSNGKTFQLYDWRIIQKEIDKQYQPK
ncbi:phytase [Chishuiella sp.]|uniref:phytase n=1 Tax=Chishuiella sp. TaxID=1969467 RepID=UPI0028ACB151|nr:phytase [Chishuiella sp.]